MLQRAENSEKKSQELQKKYDTCKRAYADAKIDLGKAMADNEKIKNPGSQPASSESEVK